MPDLSSSASMTATDEEIRQVLTWYRDLQDTMPRVLELQKAILDKSITRLRQPGDIASPLSTLSCNNNSCN